MDKLIDKYRPANYEDCFRQTLIGKERMKQAKRLVRSYICSISEACTIFIEIQGHVSEAIRA